MNPAIYHEYTYGRRNDFFDDFWVDEPEFSGVLNNMLSERMRLAKLVDVLKQEVWLDCLPGDICSNRNLPNSESCFPLVTNYSQNPTSISKQEIELAVNSANDTLLRLQGRIQHIENKCINHEVIIEDAQCRVRSVLHNAKPSFANIIRKKVACTVLATSNVKPSSSSHLDIMQVCSEQAQWASNFIVKGLDNCLDDESVIKCMCSQIGVKMSSTTRIKTRRLLHKRSDIPAWLMVTVNKHTVERVPYLSLPEREAEKVLRKRLKEKRLANPGVSYVIRNNHIVCRTARESCPVQPSNIPISKMNSSSIGRLNLEKKSQHPNL
ncbi:hypothetical protein GJ496_001687 [Pomphorhynchus laevis]|nr:hypothetical protein GJ496_001687 [Pomphorhynchus laevis]